MFVRVVVGTALFGAIAVPNAVAQFGGDGVGGGGRPFGGGGSGTPYGGGGSGGSGPRFPDPDHCYCDSYLKAWEWKYLINKGITFPDVCCRVAFAKYCFDAWKYRDYEAAGEVNFNADDEEGTPLSSISYEYVAIAKCVEYAGLGRALAHKYPDRPVTYPSGDASSATAEEEPEQEFTPPEKPQDQDLVGNDVVKPAGYPQCGRTRYWKDYIACIFTAFFYEAVAACYCDYRGNQKCEHDDCDKEVALDLFIAYDNPDKVCNQCPDMGGGSDGYGGGGSSKPYGQGGTGNPYGPSRPSGQGYPGQQGGYGYGGYGKYVLDGEPYDPCTGFCVMTKVFREYYYHYYYGYKK